jgi:tetratricopeptide (TPR) repeat protein
VTLVQTPSSIGPYAVRREIGRGGGGVVYEAEGEDGRATAVKLYANAPRGAVAAIARLRRDAAAAGALGHPNLAAVLDTGEHDGIPWVATELVDGVSLRQVCQGRTSWPVERLLDIWRQLCEGLAHAHREGVLHLDLKPADVMVTPAGEVRLLDFGSWHLKAIVPQGPGPADEGMHYRAPEVVAGRRPDRRADVFAVGAIVYELVARRRAFPGDTSTDVARSLSRCEPDLACLPATAFSPGFERVLARSLERELESRHPSFEDAHAELVQLVRDAVPRLRGASPPVDRERLVTALTQARAEDRLDHALELGRKLADLDPDDEWARRTVAEIEAARNEQDVDELVGLALSHAADGDIDLAVQVAEKVERLAPWSPRYLRLQVYLDEEKARREADRLVADGRAHLVAGRHAPARLAAREALVAMPGHPPARRLLEAVERASSGGRPPRRPLSFDPEPTEPPPPDPRAEAEEASAEGLRHFLAGEHDQARQAADRALALDPRNRRALELKDLLSVLG